MVPDKIHNKEDKKAIKRCKLKQLPYPKHYEEEKMNVNEVLIMLQGIRVIGSKRGDPGDWYLVKAIREKSKVSQSKKF